MITIYGSIGYTICFNSKLNRHIIIFSDMHDELNTCDNFINISSWIKSKFNSSCILLEEVNRNNIKLKELWQDATHTQQLKKLYLDNINNITPIDIRPFLIPFSWEILNEVDEYKKIILRDYLIKIENFFKMEDEYIKKHLQIYNVDKIINTMLDKHFINIKKKYNNFLYNNKIYLDSTMIFIYNNYKSLLDDINNILDNIMEWYICACIYECNKSIILHTGLAHSDKVIQWLIKFYNYKIIEEYGITKIDNHNNDYYDGCISLSNENNKQFGGLVGIASKYFKGN